MSQEISNTTQNQPSKSTTNKPEELDTNITPQLQKFKEEEYKKEYERFYSELYTQLVIYGKAGNLAAQIAEEAANHIKRFKYPFPTLKVG